MYLVYFYIILYAHGDEVRCPRGVMVKALDCGIV